MGRRYGCSETLASRVLCRIGGNYECMEVRGRFGGSDGGRRVAVQPEGHCLVTSKSARCRKTSRAGLQNVILRSARRPPSWRSAPPRRPHRRHRRSPGRTRSIRKTPAMSDAAKYCSNGVAAATVMGPGAMLVAGGVEEGEDDLGSAARIVPTVDLQLHVGRGAVDQCRIAGHVARRPPPHRCRRAPRES